MYLAMYAALSKVRLPMLAYPFCQIFVSVSDLYILKPAGVVVWYILSLKLMPNRHAWKCGLPYCSPYSPPM